MAEKKDNSYKLQRYFYEISESMLFNGMTQNEIRKVLEYTEARIEEYKKGDVIFLSQLEVRYVGSVLEGHVRMVKENYEGDEVLLNIITKGQLLGESFVCMDERESFPTFVAGSNTRVVCLALQKIMLLEKDPEGLYVRLMQNMIQMLSRKNVSLMEKIDVSSQKTLRGKILTYLEVLAERQKQNFEETGITVPFNRTVMAEYLGVNRSALGRELKNLQDEGILEFGKNEFWINH